MTAFSEQSSTTVFDRLWKRLELLERWRELAVRPEDECCDENDLDLLAESTDNVKVLSQRCLHVRALLNDNLPSVITHVAGPYDDQLIQRISGIPGAGFGLFYESLQPFPAGNVLCYYYGHIHNFHSSRRLLDTSYLMLLDGDCLIDAGPLPQVQSRFINDPLNEPFVNCKFGLDTANHRSAVAATRDIKPGEELFVSYGDAYWAQHATPGRIKV